jgi:hypothetical protein
MMLFIAIYGFTKPMKSEGLTSFLDELIGKKHVAH